MMSEPFSPKPVHSQYTKVQFFWMGGDIVTVSKLSQKNTDTLTCDTALLSSILTVDYGSQSGVVHYSLLGDIAFYGTASQC